MNTKIRIHFIHIFEAQNSGELLCNPYDYFLEFSEKYLCMQHDIRTLKHSEIHKEDWVILGGGGLFEVREDFQKTINFILQKTYKVISWGCGHNQHNDHDEILTKINYSRFLYLATRDFCFNSNEEYCPCVSCMNPMLDIKFQEKNKIGIIEHLDYPITEFEFPKIKNSASPRNIMQFIAESEYILTNSYHAIYWSTLMNKKVILYKPFSTKFDFLKDKPVIYNGNLEDSMKKSKNYPDALKTARNINEKFSKKILRTIDYIESKGEKI